MQGINISFAVILLAIGVRRADLSTEAMKAIGTGFVNVLNECKQELNLSDNIYADLFHFWKLDYDLLNRDTGCIIVCMSKKLELIDTNGKLHHGNAKEFAEAHGAGQELASKLVTTLHGCEDQNESVQDECLRTLEIAKCFRTAIGDLDWSPKVEIIVEEVLTEV